MDLIASTIEAVAGRRPVRPGRGRHDSDEIVARDAYK